MRSYYEKLVEEKGEQQAKAYMKSLRAKRKVNSGGGFNDPLVVQKALETRNKHVPPKFQ